MFKICKIPVKSAFADPSIQFIFNGACVEVFYGWNNSEGDKWGFHLTLHHPIIGFSINEKGGHVTDIARLIRDMNEELKLKGAKTVSFSEMDQLVPAIEETLRPAYWNCPSHSPSEDYYGE